MHIIQRGCGEVNLLIYLRVLHVSLYVTSLPGTFPFVTQLTRPLNAHVYEVDLLERNFIEMRHPPPSPAAAAALSTSRQLIVRYVTLLCPSGDDGSLSTAAS